MPRIRLSQTQLRTAGFPDIRVGKGWNEGLSATERAAHATMQSARYQQRTVDRAIQTFNRSLHEVGGMMRDINYMAELDARDVKAEWDKAMLDGIEGFVGEDGNTHGGIVRKTWQDYEHGKTSPITDLGEIEKNFQESESYKGMNSIVRRKFDRMVSADRARYLSMANRMYDRNEIDRKKFLDERADANGYRKIETVIAAKDEKGNIDDAAFETVAREETMKMVGRRMTRFMTNPEILDDPTATPESIKWKDEKFAEAFWNEQRDELRKVSIGRCEKLAENAGFGNPQWIEGKLVTNDEQLAAAERYMEELANPKTLPDGTKLPARITPEEAKALGYKCLQARSQLDHRVAQTLAAESANALAKGDLASLEEAEKKFAATAESFKGNQQREKAALIAKNKVSEAADKRATYDIMNRIANGENLSVTVQGPDGNPVTTSIFDPKTQTRYSRLYPQVQAAWNEKVRKVQTKEFKAQHDMRLLEAEAKMLEYAGDRVTANGVERANPQEYLNYLAKQVVDKKLSPSDFTKLRDKFQTGWLRGYKGQNGKMPRQMEIAGQMLDVVKSELGTDLWTAVEKDEFGGAKIDKNGLVKLDEKGERPNVEYSRNRDMWFDATEKFTTEEMIGIVNMSLSLANCDGLELAYDPTDPTKKLDKPHKVNAVEDFKTFIRGLKDSKRVLSAAQEMRRRAGYAAGVADRQRLNEMTGSKPMTSSSDDETEEEQ